VFIFRLQHLFISRLHHLGVYISPAALGVYISLASLGVYISPAALGVYISPAALGVYISPAALKCLYFACSTCLYLACSTWCLYLATDLICKRLLKKKKTQQFLIRSRRLTNKLMLQGFL
jgi:hypothetical protein